jgi:hypothetical protein
MKPMPLLQRFVPFAKFAAVLLAPFVLGTASWQLALLIPGRIEVEHWRTLVAFSSVVAGLVAIFMIFRTRWNLAAKALLATLLGLLFVLVALLFSIRPRFGDEQVYIGHQERSKGVALCE